MHLGEQIRQARIKKWLSQENMAEMLHLSNTAYGDIERNKTELTVNRLLKICEILNIEASTFIENQTSINQNNEDLIQLKAELFLAKIEAARWKEKFFRATFHDPKIVANRKKIGF